jgi:hypothetical protein
MTLYHASPIFQFCIAQSQRLLVVFISTEFSVLLLNNAIRATIIMGSRTAFRSLVIEKSALVFIKTELSRYPYLQDLCNQLQYSTIQSPFTTESR